MVNTEFQLRHLIIWSCIVIHVSSESKKATRHTKRRATGRETGFCRDGHSAFRGRAYLARTASPIGHSTESNGAVSIRAARVVALCRRRLRLSLVSMIGGDREFFVRRCLETETARRARARVDREKKKRRRLEDLSWLSGLHSEFSVTVIRPDSNKRCQKNSKQGHHRQRGPPPSVVPWSRHRGRCARET